MDPTGKKTEFMDWGLPPGVSPQNPFGLQLPPGEPDEEMRRVLAEWLVEETGDKQTMAESNRRLEGMTKIYEDAPSFKWRTPAPPGEGGPFKPAPNPYVPPKTDIPMSKDEPPDIIKLFVEGGFPAVAKMLRG